MSLKLFGVAWGLVLSVLVPTSAMAQANFVRLENVWKTGEQIHIQNGPPASSAAQPNWHSADWLLEPAGVSQVRIKNRWKGTYLHVETGPLNAGPIQPGWLSAVWVTESVGDGVVRIRNAWKGTYLNVEKGALEASAASPGWLSAQWRIKATAVAAADPPKPAAPTISPPAAAPAPVPLHMTAPTPPAAAPPTVAATGNCPTPWWRGQVQAAAGDGNWMAMHYDTLCQLPLREMALPATHDMGTYDLTRALDRRTTFANANQVFAPDNDTMKRFLASLPGSIVYDWAKTQRRTAAQQLADGIRVFDIRVCVDGNGKLLTCHGLYGAPLDDILEDVRKFTLANPGEMVFLGFNHFWDGAYQALLMAADPSKRNSDINALEGLTPANWDKLWRSIKTKLAGKLVPSGPSGMSPNSTYGAVMGSATAASTRQVVVMFDRAEHPYKTDPEIWTQPEAGGTWIGEIWERTAFLNGSRQVLNKAATGTYAGKFWSIRSSATPTKDLYGRTADPTGTFPNSLEELAAQTNPVVFALLRDEWRGTADRRTKPVNMIWADFYDGDDLVKLAKHLNGIRVDWTGSTVGKTVAWGSWRGLDHSYGRGVGKPMGCGPDEEQDGALCYPRCRDGFGGAGPVCWQRCPANFTDTGGHCAKPAPYPNGGGYPWKFGDALNDNGMIARCQADHGAGNCEKHGLIFYPRCRAGYVAVGGNICSPACPAGMTDIGVSCQKQSHTRTAGRPLNACAPGLEQDAALCYPACKEGLVGVGPMCWPKGKAR